MKTMMTAARIRKATRFACKRASTKDAALPPELRSLLGRELASGARASIARTATIYESIAELIESDRRRMLAAAQDLRDALDELERGDAAALADRLRRDPSLARDLATALEDRS